MSKATRIACSLWAQQGSNLRPLGEQRTGYRVSNTPTDHAIQVVGGDPRGARVTGKTDDKVTADLVRRLVVWVYRGERKAGAR
jgi:hypothetical protein